MLWITVLVFVLGFTALIVLLVGSPWEKIIPDASREPVRRALFWASSALLVLLVLGWTFLPASFTPQVPLGAEFNVLLVAVLMFLIFLAVPPKTLTVAQAAYREAVRQPLFWLLLILSAFFMLLSVFLPYFTFKGREELKLMKDLDLDAILLPALLLSVFTASISISEEIEGRTAITVISKPVSRREFLLGKFYGILLATLFLVAILTVFMGFTINFKIDLDGLRKDPQEVLPMGDPEEVIAMQQALSFMPVQITQVLRYVLLVFHEIQLVGPGVVMNFCQVMILTSVAVALATRLPMIINLVVCLVVFFMGRLTHILEAKSDNPLVKFVARVFDTLLPGLNYYDIGPAIVADHDVPWAGFVLPAVLHGLIYAGIALFFGLILFEDRDLA